MDSQGWIPSHLFASFPRVKTLTYDFLLVKDVLAMSSLAEVSGDFVRPLKWSRYVLPDAKPSVIEGAATLPADPLTTAQVDVEQLLLQHPPAKASGEASSATIPSQPTEHLHVPAAENSIREGGAEDAQEYEDDEDEDEEDDVVFVLGKDASRSWTPERKSES